jgi:hypothetical protein
LPTLRWVVYIANSTVAIPGGLILATSGPDVEGVLTLVAAFSAVVATVRQARGKLGPRLCAATLVANAFCAMTLLYTALTFTTYARPRMPNQHVRDASARKYAALLTPIPMLNVCTVILAGKQRGLRQAKERGDESRLT